jgi:hypothetical protein
MRLWGRRVVLWRRDYLTRGYWRELRPALEEVRALVEGGTSLRAAALAASDGLERRLAERRWLEQLKAHALEGCTPCRETLTGLAHNRADREIRDWLVATGLVAESAFDLDLWLSEQGNVVLRPDVEDVVRLEEERP